MVRGGPVDQLSLQYDKIGHCLDPLSSYFMIFMLCIASKLRSNNASIYSYASELPLLSSYAPKEPWSVLAPDVLAPDVLCLRRASSVLSNHYEVMGLNHVLVF